MSEKAKDASAPLSGLATSFSAYIFMDYFDDAMSYDNLRKALNKCCRNVRWKDSVIGYELHAARNTLALMEEIKAGTYKISKYQKFIIWEPKMREIIATRIRDRQIQMALCDNGLYIDITEHFIHDNCACQNGKGTDFALKRLKTHIRRHYQKHGKVGKEALLYGYITGATLKSGT